jgi:hypothetical protein
MSMTIGLAKVVGATRCCKWGSQLEGTSFKARSGTYMPTLQSVLANSRTFTERISKEINRRPLRKNEKTK